MLVTEITAIIKPITSLISLYTHTIVTLELPSITWSNGCHGCHIIVNGYHISVYNKKYMWSFVTFIVIDNCNWAL